MYKHGIYGNPIPSTPQANVTDSKALPVYFGTAPINTVAARAFNAPALVSSMSEAMTVMGYSDDWAKFTLCEAMAAHFNNGVGNIGPIILVNVFDPATHKKSGTTSITPVSKVAYIDKETVVLNTVAITGKVKGTDFTAEYVKKSGRNQVKITDLSQAGLGTVSVAYDEIDITTVDETEIIGENVSGVRTGLQVVDLIYPTMDKVPGILAAPGWSQLPQVYHALDNKCRGINGKWQAIVAADLDCTTAATIAAAITWVGTNGYDSERVKNCWPMAKTGGVLFHLSTLAVVEMMTTDEGNGNVPYESPSNKAIDCDGPALANGTAVYMDEQDANTLNADGITTVNRVGGEWRLWGPNMGNYSYTGEASILPESMFDSSVRMQCYLTNTLQESFLNSVDAPATDRQIQSVIDSAQPWLNGLVSMGALKGAAIDYDAADNVDSETVAGRFVFSVRYNDVRPMVALTFNVMRDGTLVTEDES
jgi:uncharacterized protein